MPSATARFAELGVPSDLCARPDAAAIIEPFPIQSAVIPDALAGRDVAGRFHRLGQDACLRPAAGHPAASRPASPSHRLAPTRELAEQITSELRPFVRQRGHDVVSVYGGVGYAPQRKAFESGVELVVACPGRLEDLIQSGLVSLGDVDQVVIDEADRMADMGFLPAVRRILRLTSVERQVLLFSATFDGAVSNLAGDIQRDPVVHEIGLRAPTSRLPATSSGGSTGPSAPRPRQTPSWRWARQSCSAGRDTVPIGSRSSSTSSASRPPRSTAAAASPSAIGPFERSPPVRCAR